MSDDNRLQRIRDPLHGLIEFESKEFYRGLWATLQTPPFQRLRRIKQLGFSDLVFPGATHSRFAHSVGTFHIAKLLVNLLNEQYPSSKVSDKRSEWVIAAALLHDIGHGPFSHAFEEVKERLGLSGVKHEDVSDSLIRDSEISRTLEEKLGRGFHNNVADIIKSSEPRGMYETIVSSQFDADRLDYMQRDRLMTGTGHGAIDFVWLLSNLKIRQVPLSSDDKYVAPIDTLVLGPKALSAAETYVVSLFQLYTTVYFHKTTRGIEKLFSEMLFRICEHVRKKQVKLTGLPSGHPLIKFAKFPDKQESLLALDDYVVWGALPTIVDAPDDVIAELARRIRERKVYKCIDIRERVASEMGLNNGDHDDVWMKCSLVKSRLDQWKEDNPVSAHLLLCDDAKRNPYKRKTTSHGQLEQILVLTPDDNLVDLGDISVLVNSTKTTKIWRAYFHPDHLNVREVIERAIKEIVNGNDQQVQAQ